MAQQRKPGKKSRFDRGNSGQQSRLTVLAELDKIAKEHAELNAEIREAMDWDENDPDNWLEEPPKA